MPRRKRNARPVQPGSQSVSRSFLGWLDNHPMPYGLGKRLSAAEASPSAARRVRKRARRR